MSRLMAVGFAMIIGVNAINAANGQASLPTAAPADTESASRGGLAALQSVARVICAEQNTAGTGFLHKSGKIITAAHVVKDCEKPTIVLSNGVSVRSMVTALDPDLDFALITPYEPIRTAPLILINRDSFNIGAQVSTWGFPMGYFGWRPMLSAGILSGQDAIRTEGGKIVAQFVVNAAFNSGKFWRPAHRHRDGSSNGRSREQAGANIGQHYECAQGATRPAIWLYVQCNVARRIHQNLQ
jgi:S1-C subfamily serine protease